MDFVKLIKLIQKKVSKCSKWSEEEIPRVLIKCKNIYELNELLKVCKYEKCDMNEKGDFNRFDFKKLTNNINLSFPYASNIILI